jgi:DNA polymerase V
MKQKPRDRGVPIQLSEKPITSSPGITSIQKLDILPYLAYEIIEIFKPVFGRRIYLNFFQSIVAAGFPSPADDFLDRDIDLTEHLVNNKSATFYIRVKGDSMQNCGIYDQAILVVDKSVNPIDGDVVLAVINGEFTCKRIRREGKKVFLKAENEKFADIVITEEMNFRVWGVVTSAINEFRRNIRKS